MLNATLVMLDLIKILISIIMQPALEHHCGLRELLAKMMMNEEELSSQLHAKSKAYLYMS
jgi:hypothetical protein